MNTKFLLKFSSLAFARKSNLGQAGGQRREREVHRGASCRAELHDRLEFELTSLDSLICGFSGR